MNFLLRLKHWQLFVILALPLLFISNSIIGKTIECLWFGTFIGWVYAIAVSMRTLIPERLKPGIGYFKFSCLFVAVATIVIVIIFGGYSINQDNYQNYGNSLWVILPFHFYLMWSIIYIFYFASKMLMSVIEGEIIGFSKCYSAFFAIWFYPIGVWFIQPSIQKILLKSANPDSNI